MKSSARKRLGVAIIVQNVDMTGGMERQALRLGENLVKHGARVWILSTLRVPGAFPRLPARVPLVDHRGRLTIYRFPICLPWRWEWALSFYEFATAAVLVLRASLIDAIYAVQWTTAVQASRVARFLDCPFFVKFAGGGEYGDFSQIARNPAKDEVLAELANAEGLVCISPQIAAEARDAGLPEARCLRIPNGVDVARFQNARPVRLPGPEGAEHVLVVGALRREKRLPELVRAFASVASARPRAHLVIAGDGVEEPAIRAAISETALDERVHLLGKRTDVPGLLAAARVFVLPSVSEGLSNALLEALAARTPIVATDIEGNRAVVEHEREALLVPLGDSAALADAILRLLQDRELAARLAQAGRVKVSGYDFDKIARSYKRVFREAARPLPGSPRLLVALAMEVARSAMSRIGLSREPTLKIGLVGLNWEIAWLFIRITAVQVRDGITDRVVALKRALGIEGEIMGRLRGSMGMGRHAEEVPRE